MATSVAVRIQHSPQRAPLLPTLLAALAPLPVDVVPDPGGDKPSAWRTYRACLERPIETDWIVVIQDDAQPCPGFASAATESLAQAGDHPVAFFLPTTATQSRIPYWQAQARGESWSWLVSTEWVPVVALAWPASLVAGFLDWCDRNRYGPGSLKADDHVVGQWARQAHVRVLATIPSLVEHPDEVDSLVNRSRQARRKALSFAADGAVGVDWLR